MRRSSTPGNSGGSHAPHAQTTRSASRRRPSSRTTAAPSGRASASDQPRAGGHRLRGERLDRVARAQDARLGLEEREAHVVDGDAREQLGRVDALARDPLGAQDGLARRLPAVVAAREPRDAAVDDERRVDLVPQRPRAPRRARVPGVGAVAAADEARLVARARAHVAGSHALDEHDVPAGQRAMARQRRAEDAGADDHERGRAAHGPQASGRQCVTRMVFDVAVEAL